MSHYEKQEERHVIEMLLYDKKPASCKLSEQIESLQKEIAEMKNALIYFGIMEADNDN